MALAAAGTVVGVNLLLMPEIPAGTQPRRLTLAPAPSGAAVGMLLSF